MTIHDYEIDKQEDLGRGCGAGASLQMMTMIRLPLGSSSVFFEHMLLSRQCASIFTASSAACERRRQTAWITGVS